MTREERCWQKLCERLLRDPATSEESDTCTLRVAFKHALAFADAEAAAMRERAAGVCDGLASSAAAIQAAFELAGSEAPTKGIQRECATTLATAIRNLPTTGEK